MPLFFLYVFGIGLTRLVTCSRPCMFSPCHPRGLPPTLRCDPRRAFQNRRWKLLQPSPVLPLAGSRLHGPTAKKSPLR